MTVAISNTALIMRKRFGMILKARREDIGMTQLEVAVFMDYGYPAMVSQIERGASALPAHDLYLWSEVIRLDTKELAKKWLYFIEPDVYFALFGEDPHALENLPRGPKTIKSAPGRPSASRNPGR